MLTLHAMNHQISLIHTLNTKQVFLYWAHFEIPLICVKIILSQIFFGDIMYNIVIAHSHILELFQTTFLTVSINLTIIYNS